MKFPSIFSIFLLNSLVYGDSTQDIIVSKEHRESRGIFSDSANTNEIPDEETPYWIGAPLPFEDVTCKPWNTCLINSDCGRNASCEFKYDDYYNGFYEMEDEELLFIMKRLGALSNLRIERRSCKGVTFLCHVTEVECFLNGDSERIALDHQWCIKNSEIDRREKGLSQNIGRRIVGLLKLIFKVLIGLPLAIFGLI